MNVGELKVLLEDLPDETEVRFAHQPSYPLQTGISHGVAIGFSDEKIEELSDALIDGGLDGDDAKAAREELAELEVGAAPAILYLAEGSIPSDSPYLPGVVCRLLGWR